MNNSFSEQSRCIAHEIRNHISICELYTRIIKKNLENEGIENNSIDNAINCITKSLKIMNNSLLDLKSLNNFTPEIKDIKSILDEGVKLSYVYINDKDIDLTFEAKESASVLIDENKFLACIVNIIKNAIESIEKKGTIKVLLDTNEDTAIIKISNNGAPIPIDKQQEIFKAGYTTKVTGSGLGLHICYNNLKAQNAELILSKSNKDLTEFEITLPIYKN